MNNKIKIVADDKIPFLKGVLEPYANIEYYPGIKIIKDKIVDADALIIRTRTKCDSDLLSCTKVKLITTATIGYDHIDTEYCNTHGIKWLNAPGCNSSSVQQYITSSLLELAEKNKFDLTKKTIGIVGVGNVGSKIQKVAETLGMKVLLNDPPREREEDLPNFCSITRVMEESDIITFHVPLNREGKDKTFHLADENFFERLGRIPIIINSSRGEVVKTSAIKNAIKNNLISTAVIDVWENEPEIDLELLNLVKYATPHIAGYSVDGKANGTAVCVNAINKHFRLGLESNWYPQNIPFAENGNELLIDCDGIDDQRIISQAVNQTYSIEDDDKIFRKSPSTFEKQRGDYPIRREFQNYEVTLENCNSDLMEKIKYLGFKIKN